ncbi:hypothetical protein DVA43_07030 [Leclercia sp. W6]|uniref:hypothetical protein n=1 Tax=Leclercia sp. W6 TaxID=2282310 RepID=UPI000DF4058F|nr:hypothetical protein [Leclercia sp. W6]AXF59313.1 hypothetical protein DVA43_07030 [Leclercia sp. W6]
MSDSLNNKELVAVGHQFAKAMSSDTPIIDIAKMLTRLAERLDCTTAALHATQAQRDQLAAENAALKSNLMFWDAEDPEAPYDTPEEIAEACTLDYNDEFIVQVANRLPNRTYRVCESREHECKVELVAGGEVKTPATDAFLAEMRSRGLDEMAIAYRKFASEDGCSCNMQSSYNLTAERAESYAAYVRRQGATL